MEDNQSFVRNLFTKAEEQRRETQRQNIITAFNMLGSQIQQMLMNPKFVVKAAYLALLMFGAFHVSRLAVALGTSAMMSRFGKPTLVRETSKVHTRNYLMIPFIWGKKFIM